MPEMKPWQRHRYQPALFDVRTPPTCDWCGYVAPVVLVPADAATARLEPGADSWHRLCESCRQLATRWSGAGGKAA